MGQSARAHHPDRELVVGEVGTAVLAVGVEFSRFAIFIPRMNGTGI